MKTKEVLLESAFKLFLKKGYSCMSISDLVESTSYSKGTIYHHFRNKEELFHEVINTYFSHYYLNVSFNELEHLCLEEIEIHLKDFFSSFTPKLMDISTKGVSRHFILFFEAYEIHPTFKNIVKEFYLNLERLLEQKFIEIKNCTPKINTLSLIAKYQGILFRQSLFPGQKIDLI